ncbi:DUF262 domain-containing protein [Candidatus Poriferisodalis sp.]|uniref:DUF262 domain-containing protein n=1 Tax=Candidatus Poriferisodalis sp. TaxID=3101277 RepID=UPI003B01A85B
MFQTGQTIKKTLEEIHRHDLVLPAIQREFVWQPEQICRLFDSLMQGYPFGTFLYWRVEPDNCSKFRFFDFVRDYHQRDNPHCPPLPEQHNRRLTAVLDGQQRLTALNIGLHGSMATKQPRLWWNNPLAFPKTRLHIDLLWQPDDDEEVGVNYRFSFLTDRQAGSGRTRACWFRVGEILSIADPGPAMTAWLVDRVSPDELPRAHSVLFQLYQVVHSNPLIAYYEETDQDLDKALQIFIRMNDGGTPLSFSDLLLSIAVAQWKRHDARQEIHDLVDELNQIGTGFRFSKDFVLKAGLMLSDVGSLRFQVNNFNRSNMATFEDSWNQIKSSLALTIQLAESFGFNGQNLASHNSLLPIAYYLHRKDGADAFLTHGSFAADRTAIREWLMRSLLKAGIWGSAVDTLLAQLRNVIRDSSDASFPVADLESAMASLGKSLTFVDEEIEDLADVRYSDRLTFALLSLIFPFVDLNDHFHLDHVFPKHAFGSQNLRDAGLPWELHAEYQSKCDRLANLQLLQGRINSEKGATMPHEWLASRFAASEAREYRMRHLLGDVPSSLAEFELFYEQRRERLKERIIEVLGRR